MDSTESRTSEPRVPLPRENSDSKTAPKDSKTAPKIPERWLDRNSEHRKVMVAGRRKRLNSLPKRFVQTDEDIQKESTHANIRETRSFDNHTNSQKFRIRMYSDTGWQRRVDSLAGNNTTTGFQMCKEEKKTGELKVPIQKALLRTANYTGISVRSIMRMKKKVLGSKPRKPRRSPYSVDSFDRAVVRRTLHDMIQRSEMVPTTKAILRKVREKINFPGKADYMRKILKELGFVWRKCETNRSVLMERNDIVVARQRFLQKMQRYRQEGRPIIYTDETYIHTSHCMKRCWQSKETGLKVPFSRGERLIIVHAGSKDGFIPDARLIFKSKSTTGDYHDDMNSANFQKWLKEKLIPNLPPRSVLVVDNASYHNVQVDRCPTQTTRKADIQAWLERNNITFAQNLLKAELIDICKRQKPEPRYVLDDLLETHGHACLRLPQYHAELNAIELIWAHIKGKVAAANVTFKMKDIMQLTEQSIQETPIDIWRNCCRHVEDVEARFVAADPVIERALERFIIYVSDEEGTFTADECSDNSETDTAFEC